MPIRVKKGALNDAASPRVEELAKPKQAKNADEEPMPWQITQEYNGPQVARGMMEIPS